jgi:NAD+ synthase (glutamine-hydrolysing)
MIKEFIHCFSMPTRFNSELTKQIARELCEELGVTFTEIPIERQFEAALLLVKRMYGEGKEIPKIALQNIQARVRGAAMWNWTNAAEAMWLQTGNMSEKAVGYTTIGGDLMGAYSLLGNLPKTVVIKLLRHIHDRLRSPALAKVLTTKASAELEENQEDETDLMPFPVLDACYALFVGEKMMPREVYQVIRDMWLDEELEAMRPGFVPDMLKQWVAKFVRLFRASIFKWVQAPQAVHLGSLDLDRERALQLPVVQSSEWLLLEELQSIPD